MKKLIVVTGNKKKAKEIEAIIGRAVDNVALEIQEIQSLDVASVAKAKALEAYRQLQLPVIVDDTGMSISTLGGLPGALVSWFLDSIGPEGILRMVGDAHDRRASVSTCIAFCDGSDPVVFEGVINGQLSRRLQGDNGFGYDPIFIPEGDQKTYAEMTAEEKNASSMRSIALGKLKAFLETRKD